MGVTNRMAHRTKRIANKIFYRRSALCSLRYAIYLFPLPFIPSRQGRGNRISGWRLFISKSTDSIYLGSTTGMPSKGQITRAATPTPTMSNTLAGMP